MVPLHAGGRRGEERAAVCPDPYWTRGGGKALLRTFKVLKPSWPPSIVKGLPSSLLWLWPQDTSYSEFPLLYFCITKGFPVRIDLGVLETILWWLLSSVLFGTWGQSEIQNVPLWMWLRTCIAEGSHSSQPTFKMIRAAFWLDQNHLRCLVMSNVASTVGREWEKCHNPII